MNYELAKELKDAGFPQIYHYDDQGRRIDFRALEVVALPTLSELIEACGEEFNMVNVTANADQVNKKWHALAGYVMELSDALTNTHTFGATPEEAVARLWLALNRPYDQTIESMKDAACYGKL